jgi:hypothetical protein
MNIEINIFTVLEKDLKNVSERKLPTYHLKNLSIIEDHDQGHLYPNLEVPRLTCPGRGSNPGLLRGKRAL